MPAYLVRTADEHDLVGFFVADDLDELLELVDECTAPDACEYLELPSGGIFWDKPGVAVPIAIDENDQPKAEIPWSKADMSWHWTEAVDSVGDDEVEEWMPLFVDETGRVVPLK